MFKLKLAAALMLLSLGGFAQHTVSGTVRDAKGQILIGASVQVQGTNRASVTNESGRFSITRLDDGNYNFLFRFLGYLEKKEAVTVSGANVSLSIALEESATITDEVVVTATRANDKTPIAYTNVSQQSIQKQNFGQDLPLLLNWTPSVVTTSDAGTGVGYTGIRIRGSDATRVNVTINGIPYNDSESQGTFWVDIPDIASSSQSIQIQRGVGTSTNGAGAFGGSINLQTNTRNDEASAGITTSAGSFGTLRNTLSFGTGLLKDRWVIDGRLSRIKSDGFIDRASSDLGSYYISGGYYHGKTIIKAIAFGGQEETYQSWYGIDPETMKTNRTLNYAGVIYDADGNIARYYDKQVDHFNQDHYQLHFSQQLNDHWNANLSLHYTYGRGYYEEYQQGVTLSDVGLSPLVLGDTTLEVSDLVTRKWLDNKFYGTTFSVIYNKEKTNLTFGGAYNQYGHAKHYGEIIWAQYAGDIPAGYRYYNGASQKNDFNIYAKWNYSFSEAFNAFADVQYRYVDYQTAGVDDNQSTYAVNEQFNFFNPKAGLRYSVTDSDVLYGSYAIANREPNRTDYLDGDIKPKSERLENLEIGWRRNSQHYNLEINYYWMNYTDQLVLTGALDNVGNPIRANVGKSFRTGFEVAGTIRFSDHWRWNVNATLSQNKNQGFLFMDTDGELVKKNTMITLSPGIIAGSQLSWMPVRNIELALLTKYVGKQYLDNTESESSALNDYVVNDLRLRYSLPVSGMKAIEFSFLLNNILDVEYSSNGYTYYGSPYYFPQAGRNYLAMLALKF